ncbi:uncharacterized protein LOC144308514 [Canis aureus]
MLRRRCSAKSRLGLGGVAGGGARGSGERWASSRRRSGVNNAAAPATSATSGDSQNGPREYGGREGRRGRVGFLLSGWGPGSRLPISSWFSWDSSAYSIASSVANQDGTQ